MMLQYLLGQRAVKRLGLDLADGLKQLKEQCEDHMKCLVSRVPARQGFQLWRCKYSSSGMRCLSRSRSLVMALVSPSGLSVGEKQRQCQARMVGGAFSKAVRARTGQETGIRCGSARAANRERGSGYC
jgi:hypothetical protein